MDEQKKYIDAEQLKEKSFSAGLCDEFGNFYGADEIILLSDVAEIPTADVQPVKRGRWIPDCTDEYYGPWTICDQCGKSQIPGNFCSNCGAIMSE